MRTPAAIEPPNQAALKDAVQLLIERRELY